MSAQARTKKTGSRLARRIGAGALAAFLAASGARDASAATLVFDTSDGEFGGRTELEITPGDPAKTIRVYLTATPDEDLADLQLDVVKATDQLILAGPLAVKGSFDRADARVEAGGGVRGLWHGECRTGPVTGTLVKILELQVRAPVEAEGGFETTLRFAKTLAGSSRARPVDVDAASAVTVRILAGDRTPPVITSPGAQYFEAESAAGANVAYARATVTDDWAYKHPFAVQYAPEHGVFPIGTTPVKVTARDAAGNESWLQFDVVVGDRTAPTPTCPAPIYVEATSAQGAFVQYAPATAADKVDASPEITYLPPDGSQLPIGTSTVEATATDDFGNAASCRLTVVVRDTTAPALSLPADQVFEATSPAGAAVTFAPATASDVTTAAPAITYAPAQGSTFPIGETTVHVTATDAHGNSAEGDFRVTVRDTIPPVIAGAVSKPASSGTGPDGTAWYSSDPTVHFTATDSGSGVKSVTPDVVVSTEGKAQPIQGTATDHAGLSAQTTVPVSVDKTAPSVAAKVTAPAAPSGTDPTGRPWYGAGEVTVEFTATDAMSGVATVAGPKKLTAEGKDQAVSGAARDHAGNEATATTSVSIDRTAPAVTIAAPAANDAGWYRAATTFPVSATDSGSGVNEATVTPARTLGSEGAGQSVTAEATDFAGNKGTATRTGINIDLTAPTIAGSVKSPAAPSGNDGARDWYNTDVTVQFAAADALSGVAKATGDTIVATEGLEQRVAGSVEDKAGNAAATELVVSIDRTAPALEITGPAPNSYGWYGSATTFGFVATDGLSGVKSSSPAVTLGEGAAQSIAGEALDHAGNRGTAARDGIDVDLTAPTIAGRVTSPAAPSGTDAQGRPWYKGEVTVTFDARDALSGVASATAPRTLATEGAGQSVTGAVQDRAGHAATTAVTVNIDRTAPSISIAGPQANGNGWYASAPTFEFLASDLLSGLAAVTEPATLGEGAGQSIAGEARDHAGNVASTARSGLNVDLTAPTIAGRIASPAAPSGNDGARDWYNTDVRVEFDAADAVSAIESSTLPQTVSRDGANQVVTGEATDLAGHTAATSVTVHRDATKPTVQIGAPEPNGAGWYGFRPKLTVTASDALSGVAAQTPSKVLDEGGNQSFTATATDHAGNVGTASLTGLNVDLTAPVVTAAVKAPAAPTGTDAEGHPWYNAPVTIGFAASDALSGIAAAIPDVTVEADGRDQAVERSTSDLAGNAAGASIAVSVDRTPPTIEVTAPGTNANGWYAAPTTFGFRASDALSGLAEVTAPITLSADGANQTVNGTARDHAGNTASASKTGINIDRTAPSLAIVAAPASPNAAGWYNADVTFTFEAADALSGLEGTPAPRTLGHGAAQSVSATVRDLAGNSTSKTVSGINIDEVAPTISGEVLSPEAGGMDRTGRKWYAGDATVRFTAADDLSGLAFVTPDQTVSREGADLPVEGIAIDAAGNETRTTFTVSVDKSKPTLAATIGGTPSGSDAGLVWYNQATVIRFTAADAISGVDAVTPEEQTVAGDGADQAVTATAKDFAGNAESLTIRVSVDRTAPVTTATITPEANAAGWHKAKPTVTLQATDAASGVARIEVDLDGAGWTTYAAPLTIEEGRHALAYRAVDVAGNVEASRTLAINVDLTPPEADIQFDPTTLDLVSVGRDALSGVTVTGPQRAVTTSGTARTYRVEDKAGNTLDVTTYVEIAGKTIKANLLGLIYNGAAKTPPGNAIAINWSLDRDDLVKFVNQTLDITRAGATASATAKWKQDTNETVVSDPKGKATGTYSGLRVLRMATTAGDLDVVYDK